MELVDENEGYDSEEDNDYGTGSQEESKGGARVIDFIKPQELQPFSLSSMKSAPSSSQQPNTKKPSVKEEPPSMQISDVPTFWLGG